MRPDRASCSSTRRSSAAPATRREEVLGRTPRLLQGPGTQRDQLDRIRAAMEQWQPARVDLINYKKNGEAFWVDLEVSPVWDHERKLTHWVAVGRDITERKTAEEKIQYLAFYDPLTRLPNRQLLLERLQRALSDRDRPREGALMFIDLDNFKVLNDTLGPPEGRPAAAAGGRAAALLRGARRHRGAPGRRRIRDPAREQRTQAAGARRLAPASSASASWPGWASRICCPAICITAPAASA